MVILSVDLAPRNPRGLRLKNPVMAASGTFGYGTEYAELVPIDRLGAIVCKGTTLHPRPGNPIPRIAETPAGMLNSIGLQNIGVEALIREKAPLWATWDVPVIVNIAGETVSEFAELAARLDGVPGISGLEVNISCPNVETGLEFGRDPAAAAAVTAAVRRATSLPVIVKLTPNVGDIVAVARAVEGAGADAVSLINTFLGMAIDIRSRRPVLGTAAGGLSGPAVKPIALRMVYEVAGAVEIPVVGIGGITTAADALEFLLAGAMAIQVGTACFANPQAPVEILNGIVSYMETNGIADIRELVGAARREAAAP